MSLIVKVAVIASAVGIWTLVLAIAGAGIVGWIVARKNDHRFHSIDYDRYPGD